MNEEHPTTDCEQCRDESGAPPASARYEQADRPLTIRTPLAKDTFIVLGIEGREAISELYRFEVDVVAESDRVIAFGDLLGQNSTVALPLDDGPGDRYFSGIVAAIEQRETSTFFGDTDTRRFTRYRISIVPKLWLLSRRQQSRMFQQKSVQDILTAVLEGIAVDWQLQATYPPRDYCAQYRETDLSFAMRLMEEEGIYFFFQHTNGEHTMVVADTPQSHPELNGQFQFEPSASMQGEPNRVWDWRRMQEVRSGKWTLWDSCFELPGKHLEAMRLIQPSAALGGATDLEVYDWPGGYASRFDGVNKGGGDQPAELRHVFTENERTAALRAQAEGALAIRITGRSSARVFMAGGKFELKRHFSDDGFYALTSVTHQAQQPVGTDPQDMPFEYRNEFTSIPFSLPFRPQRTARNPVIHGTQTAFVVGPHGAEIFTDKYGRVKVQFHWDRQGKLDIESSCWVRVASSWAGKTWGAVHIPRVGQEVVVAFEEGDPNQPIIIGSVYNAENMPPYALPANMTQSGVKSRSTPNGTGYNELRFEDKKGSEEITAHAEKDLTVTVKHDETRSVENDRTTTVTRNDSLTVKHDETRSVGNDRTTKITQNDSLTVQQGDWSTKISAGKGEMEAMQSIELKVGKSSIKLEPTGITIKGMKIQIEGDLLAEVKALTTTIKGTAFLTAKGGLVAIN